jgi:hypothetical protein
MHIWKDIENIFDGSGIKPEDLDLWKVEMPICEENKKILKNPEISIEQVFGGEMLDPGDMFLEKGVFPDTYTPPHHNIHVIITHPLTAIPGKCLPMFYLSNEEIFCHLTHSFIFDQGKED